ncbi:MAG: TM1266 family iron-only hydrogenase system putative regulator [Eubacteriales bacterium]
MESDKESRIGVVGIIIEDTEKTEEVNRILHLHAGLIVGRIGIPYLQRKVCVISLVVDGTSDDISALTGKLGKVPGIQVKSALAKA